MRIITLYLFVHDLVILIFNIYYKFAKRTYKCVWIIQLLKRMENV